jgi:hypothetical protein
MFQLGIRRTWNADVCSSLWKQSALQYIPVVRVVCRKKACGQCGIYYPTHMNWPTLKRNRGRSPGVSYVQKDAQRQAESRLGSGPASGTYPAKPGDPRGIRSVYYHHGRARARPPPGAGVAVEYGRVGGDNQ